MKSGLRDDEGGATVLAAMAMSALIAVVVMVMHVGSAVGARHQAQSAADLAALAGAGALDRGVADACETALSQCRLSCQHLAGCRDRHAARERR